MRNALAIIAALIATVPASAHGLHAAPVDGHTHGPLIVALVVLPLLAGLVVALIREFWR